MDLRKLKTLIDLVSESNVSELEITEAEGKVRIVKSVGELFSSTLLPPCRPLWPPHPLLHKLPSCLRRRHPQPQRATW